MKNYIKDFKSFAMNEANQEEDFDSVSYGSWEEFVDSVGDRMYENGMNGTLSNEGDVTAHGRTTDDENAEVVVTYMENPHHFRLTKKGDSIKFSFEGATSLPYKDIYELTDAMSSAILQDSDKAWIEDGANFVSGKASDDPNYRDRKVKRGGVSKDRFNYRRRPPLKDGDIPGTGYFPTDD